MKFNPSKKDVIFLVEGKSDKILFTKFILSDKVSLESCQGFKNVLIVAEELRKRDFHSFIAVLDSDFRYLEDNYINDKQIFFTDYHDIEISFIESNSLKVIFEKYANQEKLKSFEDKINKTFKDYIYQLASHLGYLKWANKKEDLGLVFKPKYIEGKYLKLDKVVTVNLEFVGDEVMINYVRQFSTSKGKNPKNNEVIIKHFRSLFSEDIDLKHLCNGHDLCYLIAISLKKTIGKINVTYDQIENDLRLSYDSDCFKKTKLYKQILVWEEENTKVFI
ncbi:DUF4435 domain-containing protein [Maribacter aquivivus]|uniref:DUF4435 domain-containing protein n=1 Tax=Maribacter aquivivus TaxID=228958 RepID=UPI0024907830|nr:DUF4435 domain-containing protein [Maribacter aquivivus]